MTLRTYRALIVAISTFPNDPHNLPELEGPRNDPLWDLQSIEPDVARLP